MCFSLDIILTIVCLPLTCRMLEDAGGVELLVGLLQDTVASCRQYAAECVATMAPDGEIYILKLRYFQRP